MAIKITTLGIERSNLTTLIQEYEQDFKDTINPNFSIEDSENTGQFLKIMANRENLVSQVIEQSYNVKTLNGAEHIFLDEIFAQRGIFREGKTAGSGSILVETDNTTTTASIISKGLDVSATNGTSYRTTTEIFVKDSVGAYTLDIESLNPSIYTFSIINRVTGVSTSFDVTLSSVSLGDRRVFLQELITGFQAVNTAENFISSYDDAITKSPLTFEYGLDIEGNVRGLKQTISITDGNIGHKYTYVPVIAKDKGYFPSPVNIVTAITPRPDGFVSVSNPIPLASGTEIETDAAFIERASSLIDQPRSATLPAIRSALLRDVEGVEKVIIDKVINEAKNDRVEVTPIVVGGDGQAIAEVLAFRQPVNNIFYGTESYVVLTEDNRPETIKFSRGTSQQLSVRLRYETEQGNLLASSEQNAVTDNLLAFSEAWKIGDKLFNAQFLSAVFSAVNYGRFTAVKVEIKRANEGDDQYSEEDYQSSQIELAKLNLEDITTIYGV